MKKSYLIAVLTSMLMLSCSSNSIVKNSSNSNSSNSTVKSSSNSNSSDSNVATSSSSIVGKWKYKDSDAVMEYTADGKNRSFDAKGQPVGKEMTYVADPSASPARITVNDGNINPKCIYKIEGSEMTMTCSSGPGQDFPKRFSDSDPTQVKFVRK